MHISEAMEFREVVSARRSAYSLDDDIGAVGVTMEGVMETLRSVARDVPSAYDSHPVRTFVLWGDDHRRFWGIVEDILRERVADEERFRSTEAKMRGFSRAAGTVLFYDVVSVTESLVERYPTYAEAFPDWAEHGSAMMQYAFWLAFYDMGLGANIQHYNPIVDVRVAEAFGIPEGYRLRAQMVFGRIDFDGARKERPPGEVLVAEAHSGE